VQYENVSITNFQQRQKFAPAEMLLESVVEEEKKEETELSERKKLLI